MPFGSGPQFPTYSGSVLDVIANEQSRGYRSRVSVSQYPVYRGSIVPSDDTDDHSTLLPVYRSSVVQGIGGHLGHRVLDFTSENKRRVSFLPTEYSLLDESMKEDEETLESYCCVKKNYITGSKYCGEYNRLGMAGKGVYKFPHGTIYDGFFNKDGQFHGSGTLIYPGGQKLKGYWKNGKLREGGDFVTRDDRVVAITYCKQPDRRFQMEIENGFAPAPTEYLTNHSNPPLKIPSNFYDCGEGFYDPKNRVIYDYGDKNRKKTIADYGGTIGDAETAGIYKFMFGRKDTIDALLKTQLRGKTDIVSIPPEAKEEWIKENCRRGWEEPTGYQRDLYEMWTTGKSQDDYIPVDVVRQDQRRRTFDLTFPMPITDQDTPSEDATSAMYSINLAIESGRRRTASSIVQLSRTFLPKSIKDEKKQPKTVTGVSQIRRKSSVSVKALQYMKKASMGSTLRRNTANFQVKYLPKLKVKAGKYHNKP